MKFLTQFRLKLRAEGHATVLETHQFHMHLREELRRNGMDESADFGLEVSRRADVSGCMR